MGQTPTGDAVTESAAWSTLGTKVQIEKEAMALRLLASEPVQRELHKLEALYLSDPVAAMPGGRKTARAAAEAMAMNAVMAAVNKDVDRPAITWGACAGHSWHGLSVPRSGIAIDNPDNVHRSIPIGGAAKYEISGKINFPRPAQETFILYASRSMSTEEGVRENLEEAGMVSIDNLSIGADGIFSITVDSSPADGRANHLQIPPGVERGNILVRDALSNWAVQNPSQLEVRRVSGPTVLPALDEEALAALAAEHMLKTGHYWLAWHQRVFFTREVNTFTLNFARVSGWGFARAGYFRIADDEALVMTLERRDAAYLSLQVADLWGPTVSYIERNGNLNQAQARPDADGAYTYVIAVDDPGVHNWLDPSGLSSGTFCARWQGLPPGVSAEDAVRTVKTVKLRDLKDALPPGATWVTPEQRTAQLAERAATYARRLQI